MKNAGLNQAKKARKDCFYTMREDIEKEILYKRINNVNDEIIKYIENKYR